MKLRRFRAVILLVLQVAAGGCKPTDDIEYLGQRIKLSKAYSSFDEYKNDPNNIHPSERARVQKLVRTAPIGPSYPSEEALYYALGRFAFPGYGAGNLARDRQADGREVVAFGVEIPGTEESRYFVFRSAGSTFVLIDDFVEREVIGRASVALEGAEWVFRRDNGTLLFRRAITP